MRQCEYCGTSIVRRNAQARYCSDKCRNYDRRRKAKTPYPQEMLNRDRWVRWRIEIRKGKPTKVPLMTSSGYASSTNSTTWSSYNEAMSSHAGIGLGFVLGDGIGCIDLDHCSIDGELTDSALEFVSRYPMNFIEISPSGDGLHVWGTAEEAPGRKLHENGLSIERYSAGRYITVTGNVYQHGSLLPL